MTTKPTNTPDDIAQAIISTALRVVVAIPVLAFLWAVLISSSGG